MFNDKMSKQETHWPQCTPEKTVQIEKHKINPMLIKRRENSLSTLRELKGLSFERTWIHFTQGCFVPSLIEIGPVVLEEKIFLIS